MSDTIITFPETRHVDELSFKIYPDGGLDVDFASAEGGHIAGRFLSRADVERVYDALGRVLRGASTEPAKPQRSEEHTSELQSREKLVCRLLLEKKIT